MTIVDFFACALEALSGGRLLFFENELNSIHLKLFDVI